MMPFFVVSLVRTSRDAKVGELSALICHSLMEAHYSQKQAAAEMYQAPNRDGDLSKALNDCGINLHRLLFLSRDFWRAFLPKLARLVGCEDLVGAAHAADLAREFAELRTQVHDMQRAIEALKAGRRTA